MLFTTHDGLAFRVPPRSRKYVVPLAESLHPCAIADHLAYVKAVEAAAGASPWEPPAAAALEGPEEPEHAMRW